MSCDNETRHWQDQLYSSTYQFIKFIREDSEAHSYLRAKLNILEPLGAA